jgi:hypothetical protein
VPADELPALRQTLQRAFKSEPPLSLLGGQSWMGAALSLLSPPRASDAIAPPGYEAAAASAAGQVRAVRPVQRWSRSGVWGRPLLLGGALAASIAGLLFIAHRLDNVVNRGALSSAPQALLNAVVELVHPTSSLPNAVEPAANVHSPERPEQTTTAESRDAVPEPAPAVESPPPAMLSALPAPVEPPPARPPEPTAQPGSQHMHRPRGKTGLVSALTMLCTAERKRKPATGAVP